MLRRPLAAARNACTRMYTDYHHIQYPVMNEIAYGIPLYWMVYYYFFVNCSSIYSKRNEYKCGLFRVWKRKLGTGYKWSTEWGEPIPSFWKNLPSGAE